MRSPFDRIGTQEFYALTGISKTTFFKKYRWDPVSQRRFDIRMDPRGRLSMDRDAVLGLAEEMKGRPVDQTWSRRLKNFIRDV